MILQPEYFLAFTIILLDKLKLEVIMLSWVVSMFLLGTGG